MLTAERLVAPLVQHEVCPLEMGQTFLEIREGTRRVLMATTLSALAILMMVAAVRFWPVNGGML